MATSTKTARQPWEELDADLEAASSAVPVDVAKQIDEELGLQMISIRLDRGLLKNLKQIAKHYDLGYQPMIRDLLNRFARSEMRTILNQQLEQIKRAEEEQVRMQPIDEFLERERRLA